MKKKLNAAIIIIVGRPKLFKKTIKLFYENWNNKFKYPVYVHCLREVFTLKETREYKKKYQNIFFKNVHPQVPKHIKENELFYNRVYNNYSFTNFNKGRLGYLHVLYFASNISSFGEKGCLCKEMKKYDYILRIDDDSWFRKKINFDFFKKIKKYPMGTAELKLTQNNKIHLTREKLFEFLQNYTKHNKIKVVNKTLLSILNQKNEKKLFNLKYTMGNFDLYNMKYFKSKKFYKFIKKVNKFGGQYKFRWADYDIINLFLYIYFSNPIFDLNLSKKIYYPAHPDAEVIIDDISIYGRFVNFILKRLKRYHYIIKTFFNVN